MKNDIYRAIDQSTTNSMMILRMISEESRWYTVNELSERLDMIPRTVQRYLVDLLEKVDGYQDDKIQLHTAKNKGVFLEITAGADVVGFELYLLEDNVTFMLMKAVFFEEFTSVKRFAMDNFLSETTVRRTLKTFQELLEPYGISLKRETYELVGTETQIRMFAYSVFWRIYRGALWPFDIVDQETIEDATERVSTSLRLNLTHVQKNQIGYILAINIIRIRKRHTVDMNPNWKNYLDLDNDFKRLNKMKAVFESLNIQKEGEIYFFYLLMETRPKLYENSELAQRIMAPHQKNESDIYLATEALMRDFSSEIIDIPEKKKETFFNNSFCAHLFCTLFKRFSVDINGYEYLHRVAEYYPNLFGKLDELLDKLYEETQNELFLEKQFLLTRYALLFSSIKPLTYFEEQVQIVLDTDLPKLAENNLRHQIDDTLKYRYKVHFLNKNSAHQADVILTTISTPMMMEQYHRGKILYIGPELSARDFANISNIVIETMGNK
ncbi:HTH domain-containing protein [Listeria weihenstephanensis FSL R9-0317]|uniref:Transcriptional regulator n=1 Tax=Listeria weihenstephanensis TaxID=1006155 RepID=A0A1S7FWX7_9LIST|nr:helix-turn-helix domain-containing protein [Listeria weihenstephanensis]AQY51837.1 transcriptional regulator [Listeria weihenstephanensis]EUJ40782.1 HTH domain-containing protein [Listeria weihenstephanensis FSL R9-0317]MBC1499316.1 transcriptional regulator [Listeria weihenstephanensis]